MNRNLLLVLFCSLYLPLAAQDDEVIFSQLFNEIFISPDQVENLEEVYQQLYYFHQHPLNLNKVTADDLRMLLILTDQQITDILKHRDRTGDYLSVYELQAITSLTIREIKTLVLFITVDEPTITGELNDFALVRYERDLQVRKGYKEIEESPGVTPYLGTADKIMFRMKNSIGNKISYGFITEKDAGENIIIDKNTRRFGMDHYSGYVMLHGKGRFDKTIIGDYHIQFGQGLVYSSGFALGKSAGEIAGFRRVSSGLRPHSSSLESGYLRGVASTYRKRNFKITGFLSAIRNDASLDTVENTFTSINHSGFHRTRSESGNKDNLHVNQGGILMTYAKSSISAGVGVYTIRFTSIWQPVDRLYNINAFSGKNLNTIFGHVNYGWRNINIFNESAYLHNGGFATVGGALINLLASLQTGFIYRNYAPGFTSLHGNAVGEKSKNSNEKGILWVTSWSIKKKLRLSFYFDRFSFPWLSYQISKPSQGYEYLVRVQYNFSRSTYLLAQYKEEEKGQNVEVLHYNEVHPDVKQQYQLLLNLPVNERLTLRSRLLGSSTSLSQGNGMAMLQDISYTSLKYKLTFRYAIFNTDDFENRQYAYENDVLYSFTFPALYGRGTRIYLLFKYNLSKKVKIWTRYSQSLYADRNQISSGNEMIDGNRLSEVKMQVMYKL